MKDKLIISIIICSISLGLMIGCSEKVTSNKSNNEIETSTLNSKVDNTNRFGAQGAKEDANLTIEEMLSYSIEDEFLARREYEVTMNKYGEQKPFSNIIKAEENHILQLTELIKQYNITIPEDKSKEYAVIPESLDDAYNAGIKAEVENIDMYNKFLKEDIPNDIKELFIVLRDASENHLNAFEKNSKK